MNKYFEQLTFFEIVVVPLNKQLKDIKKLLKGRISTISQRSFGMAKKMQIEFHSKTYRGQLLLKNDFLV